MISENKCSGKQGIAYRKDLHIHRPAQFTVCVAPRKKKERRANGRFLEMIIVLLAKFRAIEFAAIKSTIWLSV